MLYKSIGPLARRVAAINYKVGTRTMSSKWDDYTPERYHNWKRPTMDALPVPQGSWQEDYDKHQKKYNAWLVGGVVWFSFSLYMLYQDEYIFWNLHPPDRPADRPATYCDNPDFE